MRAMREDDPPPELPLTSLIDVVFMLLVFFLVTTNFIRREVDQKVLLPKAGVGTPAQGRPESFIVNVRENGVLVVNGRVVDADGLRQEARAWRAAHTGDHASRATIRGDGRVPYEVVMRVMGICRREGVREVDLPVLEESEADRP